MGNGSFIPNTTQVANNVLDILLPFLREGERAVLLYIFRRTFGFGREEDSIGLDQFEHGLITNTGKRLDYGCGMKRRVIIQALSFLMEAGFIERLEGGLGRTHISRYRLCIKDCRVIHQLEDMQERNANPEEIVQILHQFRKGADNAPNQAKLIKLSNTYDKGADNAPLENSADSALNRAIKGADNDTKKVQKRNPQYNRETKKEENTPPTPSPKPKVPRATKIETVCPSDYDPSPELTHAIEAKYPGVSVERLVDAMKDWSASKGEKRADWHATLRTFARREWEKLGCPTGQKTKRQPKFVE